MGGMTRAERIDLLKRIHAANGEMLVSRVHGPLAELVKGGFAVVKLRKARITRKGIDYLTGEGAL